VITLQGKQDMTDDPIRWRRLSSEPGPELPLFNVRIDQVQHPCSGETFSRLVLESPDWINVVATTAEGKLVMVEQYRFGVEDITIEPVGGIADEGEQPIERPKSMTTKMLEGMAKEANQSESE
jgi:hypothetical protein